MPTKPDAAREPRAEVITLSHGGWLCGYGHGQQCIVPNQASAERVLREQRSFDEILDAKLATCGLA